MSMTTEQALAYMHGEETVAETATSVADPKTPSVEESKSEAINVDSPNEVATKDNDGEHAAEEVKGSDEPKAEEADVEKDKKEVHDQKAQRDYAFIKLKKKQRALQERYDRDTSAKDKRIKELEEELSKRKLLTSDNFTKADGSKDIDAYVNWKSKESDLANEAKTLKAERLRDQREYEIELDRINTERCFQGKELEDYENLVSAKGLGFAEAIHEKDKKNVVFSYLDTVQDYPIVIRELMTNPKKWLPTIFRSTDVDSLKRNTAKVADMILDDYYSARYSNLSSRDPRVNTQHAKATQDAKATKHAIPVIGKQISSAGATGPDNDSSLLTSINSINSYLRKHKRH